MESSKSEGLGKFRLNNRQLDDIRKLCPRVNLYNKPLIGTEEIRQFAYCKRILYFRHIVHAPMKQTYKMEEGENKHEQLQQSKNATKNTSQKYYNIYLTDPDLGLVGLIDYFEFDGNEAYPIEIKSGNDPPKDLDNPHKYQVVAQAMLIEKNFDFLVKMVRIFYSKLDKVVDYPITIEDKLAVLKIVEEITEMLSSEQMPESTNDIGKCVDCECKNYCLR